VVRLSSSIIYRPPSSSVVQFISELMMVLYELLGTDFIILEDLICPGPKSGTIDARLEEALALYNIIQCRTYISRMGERA